MHFKQNHFNQAKTTEPKFDNSGVYAPIEGKDEDKEEFYSELQNSVDKIPNKENISTAFNKLKITNSFYRHKHTNKFSCEVRRTGSIIDDIIINDRLKSNTEDTRIFRGSKI